MNNQALPHLPLQTQLLPRPPRKNEPWTIREILEIIIIVLLFVLIIILIIKDLLMPNPIPSICKSGSIRIDGSSALYPLVSSAAQAYQQKCPGANIQVSKSSSSQGLECLEIHKIDIANADTFLARSQSDLIENTVAIVVFVVIVNNDVNVKGLTSQQIQGIYSGAYSNWSQVGGPPNLTISPISRVVGSGTRYTFEQYVLGALEKVQGPTLATDDEVINAVRTTTGAIGYVDLYTALQYPKDVRILNIDNHDPTNLNLAMQNIYRFWNFEHMDTVGTPTHTNILIDAFIQYMYSSEVDKLRKPLHYLSFNVMTNKTLNEHNQRIIFPGVSQPGSCP